MMRYVSADVCTDAMENDSVKGLGVFELAPFLVLSSLLLPLLLTAPVWLARVADRRALVLIGVAVLALADMSRPNKGVFLGLVVAVVG